MTVDFSARVPGPVLLRSSLVFQWQCAERARWTAGLVVSALRLLSHVIALGLQ